jgi:hypothetical protein
MFEFLSELFSFSFTVRQIGCYQSTFAGDRHSREAGEAQLSISLKQCLIAAALTRHCCPLTVLRQPPEKSFELSSRGA